MAKYPKEAQEKEKVMHEMKEDKLKTAGGEKKLHLVSKQ